MDTILLLKTLRPQTLYFLYDAARDSGSELVQYIQTLKNQAHEYALIGRYKQTNPNQIVEDNK